MDTRCDECGYACEDYRSAVDEKWLQSVIERRVQLMFEDLANGAVITGFGDADTLGTKLTRLAQAEDLHPAVHFTRAAARASAAMVPRPYAASGKLAEVSVSLGGVPKVPVGESGISWRGVVGDKQQDMKNHGHAWQALCIWSLDVISALKLEGHPIASGNAGENLTVRGLDWKRVRTGVRLEIADVVCELTAPAVPCNNNAQWFIDGNYKRMSHTLNPGWSRWYAAVLRPGAVRAGDEVRVVAPISP